MQSRRQSASKLDRGRRYSTYPMHGTRRGGRSAVPRRPEMLRANTSIVVAAAGCILAGTAALAGAPAVPRTSRDGR